LNAEFVARTALIGLVAAQVIVVGFRIGLHRRSTGATGVTAFRATATAGQRWSGLGFVLGFVVILAGVVAAALGHGRWDTLPIWVFAAGIGFGLIGAIGAWWSQGIMGASWGFGVDDSRETDLITDGAFGVIRNPIYTFMLFGLVGCVLMAPNPITVSGWILLLGSVEYLVRFVEEPFLARTNPRFLAYAAQTGRFLPGVGRIVVD
jgi:protein-S-isoprenylcysteine O-methyltransferase Ste14